MKLALIFLSALVVISHQQLYQQRPARGMLWWLPYYSPQRVFNSYQQPLYNEQFQQDELPFQRQLTSSSGQNEDLLNDGVADGSQDYVEDDGQNNYADTQSRNRGFPGVSSSFGGLSRYRPSFYNERPDGRFFFNYGNSNNGNRLIKTATFQLTSTVTLTTVSRCVPAIQFAVSPPPACRRKRSLIDDTESDDQFVIAPSEILEMAPTALPDRQTRETRQVMDPTHPDDLISSQNVVASVSLGEMSKADQFMANLRDKRFFLNRNSFFTSTTLTSYSFISTTITQTVSLGPGSAAIPPVPGPPAVPGVPAVQGVLKCLPAGYSLCPQ